MNNDRRIYSVQELNSLCRKLLEGIVPGGLWVRAEIRNLKFHSSGHVYFILAGEKASIDGVMWRSIASRLSFKPEEGMEVEAFGNPTLYEKNGRYQFSVKKLVPRGEGERAVAFRQLKEKLKEEGLFDPEHKRPLPKFPNRIGVVTSKTGAAVRDITNVLRRRAPRVSVILRPAKVQGDGAAADIAAGIQELNRYGNVDLIIAGRGGGSEDDLWCFNDEALARVIFDSEIPVISAVGHEIDFTISDFVADLRAPTPSAAAELAVPDREELRKFLMNALSRSRDNLKRRMEISTGRLDSVITRPGWGEPDRRIREYEQLLDDLILKGDRAAAIKLEKSAAEIRRLAGAISSLSSRRILRRGFAIVRRGGEIIQRSAHLSAGDEIEIEFTDGRKGAEVN